MKIEDGIIDPPRRMRLHSSSFCLFRRVAGRMIQRWTMVFHSALLEVMTLPSYMTYVHGRDRSHNITHSGVRHHKEDVRLCFSSGSSRNKMPSCGVDPS